MNSKFESIIREHFSELSVSDKKQCARDLPVDENNINKEFRLILDRMAIELVHNTFDNERLVKAMIKLSSIERIVIVFHIVLGLEMPEIAYLLDFSLDNAYARKYRGIKLLRKYINEDL